jgi:hypothetical protein
VLGDQDGLTWWRSGQSRRVHEQLAALPGVFDRQDFITGHRDSAGARTAPSAKTEALKPLVAAA